MTSPLPEGAACSGCSSPAEPSPSIVTLFPLPRMAATSSGLGRLAMRITAAKFLQARAAEQEGMGWESVLLNVSARFN